MRNANSKDARCDGKGNVHYWKHLKENYSVIELFTFGFDDVCQAHG